MTALALYLQSFQNGWHRALSFLRPAYQVLMTPDAVVLEPGSGNTSLVRRSAETNAPLEEQFRLAVADLLAMIDACGAHGRRLHIVVSDAWARPLVVPSSDEMPNETEMDSVLEHLYRRTYGPLMEGWSWCWSMQQERLVAVAWPAAGLAELHAGLHSRACVLASAKPLAIDLAGDMVSALLAPDQACWLVLIEPQLERQSITLVRQQSGIWDDWIVMPADAGGADSAVTLPLQLAREAARRGDDCRQAIIMDLSGVAKINLIQKALADQGWQVRVRTPAEVEANANAATSTASRLSRFLRTGLAA